MANFEDEYVFYWNQRGYKKSVSWDIKKKLTATNFQQGHISTASPQLTLMRTFTIKNRISISATRHRTSFLQNTRTFNEENITDLVDMTPWKTPDPNNSIESNK